MIKIIQLFFFEYLKYIYFGILLTEWYNIYLFRLKSYESFMYTCIDIVKIINLYITLSKLIY